MTSKVYDGLAHVIFGFDREVIKPRSLEIYNPHEKIIQKTYTIPDIYFTNNPAYEMNYTFNSQDTEWLYDGEVWLWSYGLEISGEWSLEFNKNYTKAHKTTHQVFYEESLFREWWSLAGKLDWSTVNFNFGGMDKWIYAEINLERNRDYYARIWLDVSPSITSEGNSKYWLGFKPASETLQESILSGHLYYLDPWYNNDWDYRKSHVIMNSTGAGTNYQINFTVHYGAGSDSAYDVYLDSKSQTDFEDIRVMDNDEVTLLDIWNSTYYASDNMTFWVEVADNLTSNNATIYLYYGNAGASSVVNGTNTFLFFDDFLGSSVDANKWDTLAGDFDVGNSNLNLTGGEATRGMIEGKTSISVGSAIYSDVQWGSSEARYYHFNSMRKAGDYNYRVEHFGSENSGADIRCTTFNGVDQYTNTDWTPASPTNYHTYRSEWETNHAQFYQNNTEKADHTTDVPSVNLVALIVEGSEDDGNMFIDWVFVKKWVNPEPIQAEWGAEEVETYELTLYFYTGIASVTVDAVGKANGSTTSITKYTNTTLSATASGGYAFERYNYDSTNITSNPYSHNMTGNVTMHVYALPVSQYGITLTFFTGISSITLNGTTSANNTVTMVNDTEIINVESNASQNYAFSRYEFGNGTHLHDNPMSHIVSANLTIYAYADTAPSYANLSGMFIMIMMIALSLGIIFFMSSKI